MRLVQLAQHADDLPRAAAFYADLLGAPAVATFDPPGLVFFDLDGVRLLIDRAAPTACTTTGSMTSTPPSNGCAPPGSRSNPSPT